MFKRTTDGMIEMPFWLAIMLSIGTLLIWSYAVLYVYLSGGFI